MPQVTLCSINAPAKAIDCSNGQKVWQISFDQADKFVCESPADAKIIFDYIKSLEKRVAGGH